MNRPVGVTILAVLNLIGGILGVFFNAFAFLFGGLLLTGGVISGNAQTTGGGAIILVATTISLLVSLVAIAVSYGLFTLKEWAWLLTYIIQIVNIITNATKFLQSESLLGAVINIIIAAIILYYLNQPNVKVAFGKA